MTPILRRNELDLRRQLQLERVPGIIKRNVPLPLYAGPKQRPLTMPKLRTGKQYSYIGKR